MEFLVDAKKRIILIDKPRSISYEKTSKITWFDLNINRA